MAATLIVTVLSLSVTTSMTALIFGGAFDAFLPRALGLAILGAAVVSLVIALLTSVPGIKGGSQDIFSALLAVMAGGLALRLGPDLPAEDRFLTLLLAVALITFLAGLVFYLFGSLRLARLVRYLPYPVVGGFVAGTGWLLLSGSLRIMIGGPLTAASFAGAALLRWLPGIVLALLLYGLNRRVRHPVAFPAALVGGVALFFLAAIPAGQSLADLQAGGWLLGPFPDDGLLQLPTGNELARVAWPAIVGEAPAIASAVGLSMVALLLNAGGIELASGRDVDLEREMRAAGLANIVAGLLGGMGGYTSLSQSVLVLRIGADSRWVGVCSGLLGLAVALVGGSLLSLFPRLILGGLIAYLGLSFLLEWVFEAAARLPRVDYAIVVGILIVIANGGFMVGIVVGLLATVVLFVINYSWIDVVRRRLNGRTARSRVTRAPAQNRLLDEAAGRLLVLELHGFLFFGTAFTLQQRLRAWLTADAGGETRYAVLDLSRVSGIDTTATMSFVRMRDAARDAATILLITGADDRLRGVLTRAGFGPQPGLRYEHDLDHALEWYEEQLLARAAPPAVYPLADALVDYIGDRVLADVVLSYWERRELQSGDIFIHQGRPADALFWVESGRVSAQLRSGQVEPLRLETMTGGRVVGELGFFLNQLRTADVVADGPTVVYRLTRDRLARLEVEAPQGAAALQRLLITLLSERMTHLIGVVGALR